MNAGKRWMGIRLFAAALLLLAAAPALALNCSDAPYFGVIDGNVHPAPPSQVQIDTTCRISNFPASNPLITNFSFLTQPGQTQDRWLVIFDNVVHLGNMSCNATHEHKIWFVNGSSSKIKQQCQNLLIPVEKIEKQNPAGQTTAVIGTPFTYRLVIPVLFDPATDSVINFSGSPNDLHGLRIWDDLNDTGADLTYLEHQAYWLNSGVEVPHSFSNAGGLLTFVIDEPVIPAESQFVIDITVVLGASPVNTVGTQFVNTAKWEFGRLIEGVFYEPLPGEWGVSPPMTIVGPDLAMTKTGPATMNLGELGEFVLDIQNIGNSTAWEPRILDRFPDGVAGGMCDFTPEVLSAQVFAPDGVTPVAGKGPLQEGTDYVLGYSAAPSCELSLEFLTPASAIGAGERLLIRYRTKLDAGTQDGISLTNVAGAVEWFHIDAGGTFRQSFPRTLTDGTVGVLDHEDAHTVTVALSGLFYEKTVANLSTGVNPTSTARPGDVLRYTLRLRTLDDALNGLRFRDDLGALNTLPAFVPGSLALVSVPPGADTANTNPNGGTNGAGLLDIRNLDLPAGGEVVVQFDITVLTTLSDGDVVTNQAQLFHEGAELMVSDDPNVNGPADPNVAGDEDPTRVLIETEPAAPLQKLNTRDTAAIGEHFSYQITVPSMPHSAPLSDVRIIDDLATSAADLGFVSVTKISGSGAWTPVNTGTSTRLVIEDPVSGIDIPAGEQVVVEVTVQLLDTSVNVAGLEFTNTASYTYNLRKNDATTARLGEAGTSGPMTIVEPELTLEKNGPVRLILDGPPGTFRLNVHNTGDSPAYALTLTDLLPSTPQGGTCDAAPVDVSARLFLADGVTPVAPALTAGTDFSVTFAGVPACVFTIRMLTAAAAIGPDQRLIVSYRVALDAGTEQDATLTNIAGATRWFSVAGGAASNQSREYTRTLTNGTIGVLDHEDAHTVTGGAPMVRFEKSVANLSRGEDPGTVASPGETLRYRLVVENMSDVPINEFSIRDELDRLNQPPAFQAGTLNLVTVPAGVDTSGTNPGGGANGTGLLELRNLQLAGRGDSVLIEFDVVLAPILANGRAVLNQSQMLFDDTVVALSDDPNVSGDGDPTRILVESAPAFVVQKTSAYLDGDPAVLLAGERLRYTITVRNVGTDHASDATLRDEIPANTRYVPGSTTLNGLPVPDAPSDSSPLSDGILISAPADPTPGVLRVDDSNAPDNIATLTFDVVVDEDTVDGTVISNQAFVSAPAHGVADQPSDDPRTPIANDPTRDVVGNVPALLAEKTVELLIDEGSPGIVDPGDVLRYTITLYNFGNVPATGVVLTDPVPPDTTYRADSLHLNELPVGQPDGGISPLIAGIDISSADLMPPPPAPGAGTLSPGGTASIRFDVRVNDGVSSGTIIRNQAVVSTEELPEQLTDGDGNPNTGPQPTEVVVGDRQQLAITKQVAVVGGGAANAGATLEYTVEIRNIATVPAFDVTIIDDLDVPIPGQLSFVSGSASMNGSAAGISFLGSQLTAAYSAVYGALPPGGMVQLRFRAVLDPGLAIGTTVTNVAVVEWNAASQSASASVSLDLGGTPGVGVLNGAAWHDANFDRIQDGAERPLQGWSVELYRNGQRIHSTLTGPDGAYRISGLGPNDATSDRYELRFRAPDAGAATASLGQGDSPFTNGPQTIDDIVFGSGGNLQNLNLPIDPNGVVYDAMLRAPIAGATVTLLRADSGVALPAACFDDPVQQNQVTRGDGHYKFDLNFADPGCATGGEFLISVVPPGSGYVAGPSEIMPPNGGNPGVFVVPSCPGGPDDAVPATPAHCEAQVSEFAPPVSVPARTAGTRYFLHLVLDPSQPPGSSQLFNNHVPIDPELDGAVTITKSTPARQVSRGELVPYVITVNNVLGVDLLDLSVIDRYPAGFRYVEGSARIDGVPTEPQSAGRELTWSGLGISTSGTRTIVLLLAVGAGVGEGEFVNRAQAVHSLTRQPLSGEATATVRVVPDPTFDCTDVLGKVFDDRNRNGVQDPGEPGLPGVRLVTARGLVAVTDAHGRFHITCAVTPREGRGSNFVLKLDDRSLPTGYRMSTDQVMVERATRGKALRFNFGASIHRVVALDIADAVFVPGTTTIRHHWRSRFALLLDELRKAPAVLRLSYLADVEDPQLVERRLQLVRQEILDAWTAQDCCYELTVEQEVFWRRGAPPARTVGSKGRGQ
ncbi:MAG: SdrD B-like domain-containing protein [Gammaproteobacteria bacterium]